MANLLRFSVDRVRDHRRLVWVLYLTTLAPALLWAGLMSTHLFSGFADRPMAEDLLGPKAFMTWMEYTASPDTKVGAVLGLLPLFLVASWLLQIYVSAGVTHVLVGAEQSKDGQRLPSTLWAGMHHFGGRFARSGLIFLVAVVLLLVLVGSLGGVGTALADGSEDETWKLRIFVLQVLLGLALFIPLDLAYDLSRISAVAHDGRKMFRGFRKALGTVVRSPRYWLFYLGFALAAVAVMAIYGWVSGLGSASGGVAIFLMFCFQQIVLLVRSRLKLGLWAGEVGMFRESGEPTWCGEGRRPPVAEPLPQLGDSSFVV
ncbi:MAG: hypothetical protein K0U98_02515 [Deltaproteobacteria bacterium]|nr:hypothetical protein [Deltaproteobacteria bacterium]